MTVENANADGTYVADDVKFIRKKIAAEQVLETARWDGRLTDEEYRTAMTGVRAKLGDDTPFVDIFKQLPPEQPVGSIQELAEKHGGTLVRSRPVDTQ